VSSNPNPEASSNRQRYPAVSVNVVVFSIVEDELNVLLAKRKFAPFRGMWAIPGSFLEMEESLDEAAIRELAEKTGVTGIELEQFSAYNDPGRDPRMNVVTVAYYTLLYIDAIQRRPGDDAAETHWFSISHLPKLAFDHQKILEHALAHLQTKLQCLDIRLQLLPDFFTLSEIQKAYEVILGKQLDKRNFRRKILALGILAETGRRKQLSEGRPAMLYQYRKNSNIEFQTRR